MIRIHVQLVSLGVLKSLVYSSLSRQNRMPYRALFMKSTNTRNSEKFVMECTSPLGAKRLRPSPSRYTSANPLCAGKGVGSAKRTWVEIAEINSNLVGEEQE
jgi:hypothetical protein